MARPGGNPNLPHFKKGTGENRDPRIHKGTPDTPDRRRERQKRARARMAIVWDLRTAAKALSEEGMKILSGCMRDPNASWSERIRAVELIWNYGWGRPEITAHIDQTHRFAVVPAVQSREEWLAEVEADAAAKRMGGAPTKTAGHSKEPEVLDLTAEPDPRLDPDPTAPAPAGSKLN
jgi:hypothetical protein